MNWSIARALMFVMVSTVLALGGPTLVAGQDGKEAAKEKAPAKKAQLKNAPKKKAVVNEKVLLDPKNAENSKKAPESFKVLFETTKGDFVIQVTRSLAPLGSDRFYNLVRNGFYQDVRFFRVLPGFMAQFGINGNPKIAKAWFNAAIKDDPVTASNTRGMVSFAMRGPNTRTTQLFINYGNNKSLDMQGFSPFGEVIEGMEVVDALHADYGEGAPRGKGPDQQKMVNVGNSYLTQSFSKLDHILQATLMDEKEASED